MGAFGFDLKAALQESVKGVWNGDVDLGDNRILLLHQEYERRKSLCRSKDLQQNREFLESRLKELIDCLQLDVNFLSEGLISAEQEYQTKFNAPNTSQHMLKTRVGSVLNPTPCYSKLSVSCRSMKP